MFRGSLKKWDSPPLDSVAAKLAAIFFGRMQIPPVSAKLAATAHMTFSQFCPIPQIFGRPKANDVKSTLFIQSKTAFSGRKLGATQGITMTHQDHKSSFFSAKKSTLERLESNRGELHGAAWLIAHDHELDLDNPTHHDKIAEILSNQINWGVPTGCRYYVQVDDHEEVMAGGDPLEFWIRVEEEAERELALAEAEANPLGFALAAIEARGGGVAGRRRLADDAGITDRQLRNRLEAAKRRLDGPETPLF